VIAVEALEASAETVTPAKGNQKDAYGNRLEKLVQHQSSIVSPRQPYSIFEKIVVLSPPSFYPFPEQLGGS
jgi:hypothetical protein